MFRVPNVDLVQVTDANRPAVTAIYGASAEGRFVSSVADSIDEAHETPEGSPWYRAAYDPNGERILRLDLGPDA